MPRTLAFASDFDGTLCFHKNGYGSSEFRDADKQAVAKFRQAGGLFGICTGRAYEALVNEAAKHFDLDFCIAVSGAAIYDGRSELLWSKAMDLDVVRELYASYRPQVNECLFSTTTYHYAVGEPPAPWPGVRLVPAVNEVPEPVLGFSIETETVEEATQIAAELAERYAGACVGYQNLNSVDVVAPGCSKGTGIAFVREHFGAYSVAAMGDSFNDLPMLEAADVAYTFPYVVEDVRDAADYLVSGVAEALEHFA